MIAVLGGGDFGTGLARRLAELSHDVGHVGRDVVLDDPVAVQDALDALGPLDAVVMAPLADPAHQRTSPLVEISEAQWRAQCEAPLLTMLACLRVSHAVLRQRGGRIVVVVPTIAMTGAARRAPLASAAEGTRSLAKAAARQWGEDGVTVNCVAVDVDGASKMPPALADVDIDVAAVVAMLAGDAASSVTGATVAADGGRWMPA